jgi:hypothetical protein
MATPVRSLRQLLPHAVRTVLAVAACVAGYYALPYGRNGVESTGINGTFVLVVALVVLVALILRQVGSHLREGGRDSDVESLLLALCLTVIAFSLAYLRLAAQFDGLSTKTDALYFTVSTLATVGYGDVHPVGQTARGLATIQMAVDLVFVATLLTILSGILDQRVRQPRRGGASEEGPGPG